MQVPSFGITADGNTSPENGYLDARTFGLHCSIFLLCMYHACSYDIWHVTVFCLVYNTERESVEDDCDNNMFHVFLCIETKEPVQLKTWSELSPEERRRVMFSGFVFPHLDTVSLESVNVLLTGSVGNANMLLHPAFKPSESFENKVHHSRYRYMIAFLTDERCQR